MKIRISVIDLIIPLVLLQGAIQNYTGFSYIDELLTVFLVLYYIIERLRNRCRLTKEEYLIMRLFAVFYILGILASLIYNYQNLGISFLSGFFSIKSMLAYFGMRAFCQQHMQQRESKVRLMHEMKFLLYTSAILLLIDLIYPMFPRSHFRFGMYSTTFVFYHPTELSCLAVLLLLVIRFLESDTGRSSDKWLVNLAALFIVIRGGRVKAVAFVALFLILEAIYPMMRKFKLRYCLVALPFVWIIGRDQVLYYLDPTSARGRLYYTCYKIMKDHFPFGSGFATYGTELSIRYYSQLYSDYGLSNIYGFSQSYSSYITDTMWAGVFAETGLFGGIIYLLGYIEFFVMIFRRNIADYSKLLLSSMIIYGLFESIADSFFMANRGVALMVLFAYMFTSCTDFHSEYTE